MYTIGEIAKRFNTTTDTLRYYDKENLLPFVQRDKNGRRIFTDDDLGYLEVIECLKKSAIPIKEISIFIQWCMLGESTLDERYDFIVDHEKQLEDKIKALEANLAFLRWKKWYYKRAKELGSESSFYTPGTTQVRKEIYDEYLETLKEVQTL